MKPTNLAALDKNNYRWAEGAVVYHVYPRSLQDSNGDGVGDLPGVLSRLDYIQSLGVTTIWLSPFYPSPMADFGYDVADYCNVDPVFGTLADFDELLGQVHARGMKLIVDLVPNHTSDEHKWFRSSRKSKTGTYSDWYVWRDARLDAAGKRRPPNNWRDVLSGGSAWQWEPAREQYYLHSFHTKQPDLNWSNQKVREAIKDVMRFWLDRGVDGFRVDAVYWMAKEPLLSDDAPNPDYAEGEDLPYEALAHNNSCGWPVVYAYLTEMANVLKEDKYLDTGKFIDRQRFMITEAYPEHHNPIAAYMNFYVGMDPQVSAPFNFEGLELPWEATAWRRFIRSFHSALQQFSPECVPSYAFGNHDKSRIASRLGHQTARGAAVMLLTLPGMVFVYYGDELGMADVHIPPEQVQDPAAHGGTGRDPARTPMQWSADVHAGFSQGEKTWLPVAENYETHNVETESADPTSTLSLYRALGQLRAHAPALKHGDITVHDLDGPQHNVLCYSRTKDGETYVVFVNFSRRSSEVQPPQKLRSFVLSSHSKSELGGYQDGSVHLQPLEAAVFAA
jgi:alpha-glucosidase